MRRKVLHGTSAGKTASWNARGTGRREVHSLGPSVKTAAGVPGEAR